MNPVILCMNISTYFYTWMILWKVSSFRHLVTQLKLRKRQWKGNRHTITKLQKQNDRRQFLCSVPKRTFFRMQYHKIKNVYFSSERGYKRRGEANQCSLYKVTDPEILMPTLYCFCLQKKELRILVTQNKCWSCPIWGEFEWREIDPNVPHCHMLSELGSREVCKSIQELGPSLPTNGAEVKGKEFWQRMSPSHELLSRCPFTQPDNRFPSPYWKAQHSN